MYHVHAKEQGDAQPGVFHRQLLHVAYLGYSFQVEKASDEPALNLLGNIAVLGLSGSDFTGDGKVQLADFLFYGHSLYQRIDKAVHVLRGFLRLHRGSAQKGACQQQACSSKKLLHDRFLCNGFF